MKYLLSLFLLLSVGAQANRLPKEVTDDFLKVQTVTMMQQMFPPPHFYNILIFDSLRETEPTYEFASGFAYLQHNSGNCFALGVMADSHSCSDISTCQIEAESMELQNCDLRSVAQQTKATLAKWRLKKKTYVLKRQCERAGKCAMKWFRR